MNELHNQTITETWVDGTSVLLIDQDGWGHLLHSTTQGSIEYRRSIPRVIINRCNGMADIWEYVWSKESEERGSK